MAQEPLSSGDVAKWQGRGLHNPHHGIFSHRCPSIPQKAGIFAGLCRFWGAALAGDAAPDDNAPGEPNTIPYRSPGRTAAVNRKQLLRRLHDAWADLQDAYAGLTGEELTRPGVTEAWSVKDILAHVTTWEEECLANLPRILRGEAPSLSVDVYRGIDAFNAQKTAEKRDLSLAEVLAQLEDTHRRLIAYVEQAPEEAYAAETPFRRRLRWDTYDHYKEHGQAIRAWREGAA